MSIISDIRGNMKAGMPETGIVHLDEADSTNLYMKKNAEMFREGGVVIADVQTGGRGRFGRDFFSGPGGLYMSVLLRPEIPAHALSPLTISAAVLICDAIEEECGIRPDIKWPNDLVIYGKKLCGILTELVIQDGKPGYVVIGIGINLNTRLTDYPEDLRPLVTTVLEHTGKLANRERLVALITDKLLVHCGGERLPLYSDGLIERCKENCITIGADIKIKDGKSEAYGKAIDIRKSGALVIMRPDGSIEERNSGEI